MTDNNVRPDATAPVVVVVNDLIFGSKVRGAAEQTGTNVTFVRSADALHEHAAGARLVLLDLETRWLDAEAEIRRLKADPTSASVPVVAFGSHLQTQRLTAARAAGADRVMARSAFVTVLPTLLAGS